MTDAERKQLVVVTAAVLHLLAHVDSDGEHLPHVWAIEAAFGLKPGEDPRP